MNNEAATVKSRATRLGTLHVVGEISNIGGEQSEQAAMHGRVWLGDVVAAVLVCCLPPLS
jgi:hypothetical protein